MFLTILFRELFVQESVPTFEFREVIIGISSLHRSLFRLEGHLDAIPALLLPSFHYNL